jgi:hypothetical protein
MKNLDYLRKKAYDAVDFSKHSTVAVAILVEICLGSLLILFSLVVFLKIGEDVLGTSVDASTVTDAAKTTLGKRRAREKRKEYTKDSLRVICVCTHCTVRNT